MEEKGSHHIDIVRWMSIYVVDGVIISRERMPLSLWPIVMMLIDSMILVIMNTH
jgi:hypothetical protein